MARQRVQIWQGSVYKYGKAACTNQARQRVQIWQGSVYKYSKVVACTNMARQRVQIQFERLSGLSKSAKNYKAIRKILKKQHSYPIFCWSLETSS